MNAVEKLGWVEQSKFGLQTVVTFRGYRTLGSIRNGLSMDQA